MTDGPLNREPFDHADWSLGSAVHPAEVEESEVFDTGDLIAMLAVLDVTAVVGDCQIIATLNTTLDGVLWVEVAGGTINRGAVGQTAKLYGPVGRQCRWNWEIAGEPDPVPSITFDLLCQFNRDD